MLPHIWFESVVNCSVMSKTSKWCWEPWCWIHKCQFQLFVRIVIKKTRSARAIRKWIKKIPPKRDSNFGRRERDWFPHLYLASSKLFRRPVSHAHAVRKRLTFFRAKVNHYFNRGNKFSKRLNSLHSSWDLSSYSISILMLRGAMKWHQIIVHN